MARLGGQHHADLTSSAELRRTSWVSGTRRAYARRSLSGSDYSTIHRSSSLFRRHVSTLLAVAAICGATCVPAASVVAAPRPPQASAQVPSPVNRVSNTIDDA